MSALRGRDLAAEDGPLDANLAVHEVKVVPLKSEGLAEPKSRSGHQQEQRMQAALLLDGCRKECLQLPSVEGLDVLLSCGLRHRKPHLPTQPVCRIGEDDTVVHCGIK